MIDSIEMKELMRMKMKRNQKRRNLLMEMEIV
jgi:hypothetical protein